MDGSSAASPIQPQDSHLRLSGENRGGGLVGTQTEEPPSMREGHRSEPISGFHIPVWKRCFDLTCIFLSAPVWLPLMAMAVLIVKLVSPGPVFFRQRRIGLGGAEFMIFKFRSMKLNAETRTHEGYLLQLIKTDAPMTKLDLSGDPRLIPGGRLFRATGFDELPQIFNVIRGEMTLVGPRPCTPHEFSQYTARQKRRVEAPPGLTGLWQINGKNTTTFSQMIEWDIRYAETMSPWMDAVTILKTIPAVTKQVIESQKKRRARLNQQSRE